MLYVLFVPAVSSPLNVIPPFTVVVAFKNKLSLDASPIKKSPSTPAAFMKVDEPCTVTVSPDASPSVVAPAINNDPFTPSVPAGVDVPIPTLSDVSVR